MKQIDQTLRILLSTDRFKADGSGVIRSLRNLVTLVCGVCASRRCLSTLPVDVTGRKSSVIVVLSGLRSEVQDTREYLP